MMCILTRQYSYPCEDGELELVRDASLSLAAHGQYMYVRCALIDPQHS
jgi:hypothetical protein